MKINGRTISEYALRFGLGSRTGIPLNSEAEGRIPTDEYMMKTYKRRLLNGDVANLSIGQGDTLITPLQMAQAMAAVGQRRHTLSDPSGPAGAKHRQSNRACLRSARTCAGRHRS
jgi:penicillin-binding protein 2